MTLIFIVTVAILCIYPVATFQPEESTDSYYEDVSPKGSVHRPSVGLPIGSWNILDLNTTSKTSVCNDQLLFCDKQCGGPDLTSLNFCNLDTMAWGCDCKKKIPDCPPYQWPVSVAECSGRENACHNGCTEGPTNELCVDGCNRYYKCNQPGGIASALRTNASDEKPSYNVPIPNQAVSRFIVSIYSILLSSTALILSSLVFLP